MPGASVSDEARRMLEFARESSQWVRDLRLGSHCWSCGAQAWTGLKYGYLGERPLVITDPDVLALEGRAIAGGRCEVWQPGVTKEPTWHLDITSHYPSICVDCELPERLEDSYRTLRPLALERMLRSHALIAEVEIETDEPVYPYRDGDQLLFPVGRFATALCGPELRLAVERGDVIKVGRVQRYRTWPWLRGFAEAMLVARAKAKKQERHSVEQWLKRVANSVVGCLARRDSGWEDAEWPAAHSPWGQWITGGNGEETVRWRSIAGVSQRWYDRGWGDEAIPSAAAWIYSEGRARLWRVIATAGLDQVLYCDTDGLVVSDVGYRRLVLAGLMTGEGPGCLRVVGRYDEVEFIAPKHYRLGARSVCAGVPLEAPPAILGRGGYLVRDGLEQAMHLGSAPEATAQRHEFRAPPGRAGAGRTSGGRNQPVEVHNGRVVSG
jgi:hypothetical protein